MKIAAPDKIPRGALTIDIDGHPLVLCPEHAVFDPRTRVLLIADAHFGKAATFRAHGIPVPSGTTLDNLARLDRLIAHHAPARLVFLGDLLHARPAQAPAIVAALTAWRDRHADLDVVLVKGNHDRHAGPPATALRMREVDEPWQCGAWTLCHHPQSIEGAYVLAGHEHPVYRLRTASDALRLPCFRFGAARAILPAFGDFTGGHLVNAAEAKNERLYVVAGDSVHAVVTPK